MGYIGRVITEAPQQWLLRDKQPNRDKMVLKQDLNAYLQQCPETHLDMQIGKN